MPATPRRIGGIAVLMSQLAVKALSQITQVLSGQGIASGGTGLLDPQDAALGVLDHQTVNESRRECSEVPRSFGDALSDRGSPHCLEESAGIVDVGSSLGQRCLRTPLRGLKLRYEQRRGCRDGHSG